MYIYIYIYIRVFVYLCFYICICNYVHINTVIYLHTYIFSYVYTYKDIHIQIHIYIYMFTYMSLCVYIYIYLHTHMYDIYIYMVPPGAWQPPNDFPPSNHPNTQWGGLAIYDHPSRSHMLYLHASLVPPKHYITGYLHAVFTTAYMPIQSISNLLLPISTFILAIY